MLEHKPLSASNASRKLCSWSPSGSSLSRLGRGETSGKHFAGLATVVLDRLEK